MRTTITLDPASRLLVERAMRERGLTFKQAVNDAIQAGLAPDRSKAGDRHTVPRDLGPARVDLSKALGLAGELEDDTLARRHTEGR